MMKAEPMSSHHGPTAMLVMLFNGGVCVALFMSSPNPDTPVVKLQRETRLVGKKHPSPLVPCPCSRISCKVPPIIAITWSERKTNDCASRSKVCFT